MNIIIIGFGSIGRRHYKNLLNLGIKPFVYDVDKKQIQDGNVKTIPRLEANDLRKFDIAFICNPNNRHIKTAIKCAQSGCHLFIEKPLSYNLAGIDKLKRICRQKKLITMVGCNMRFHPCLKFIKKYLVSKKLGKIYSISHEFGYWLPYWRPNQDYRKNYAAYKNTGGGIILDDIHEFDLLFWFNNYELVIDSKFIFDKVSNLKIETEDICQALFRFKNNVFGLVKCDYLQKAYTRKCSIVGAKGNLEWDFNKNIVWLKTEGEAKKLLEIKKFNFNNVYVDEVKYFLQCVKKKQATCNDIDIAYNILKYCLKR